MLNARSGASGSADEYLHGLGSYILKTEHQFNLDAGLTSQRDRLPEFFSTDRLPPSNDVWDFTEQEIGAFWDF